MGVGRPSKLATDNGFNGFCLHPISAEKNETTKWKSLRKCVILLVGFGFSVQSLQLQTTYLATGKGNLVASSTEFTTMNYRTKKIKTENKENKHSLR